MIRRMRWLILAVRQRMLVKVFLAVGLVVTIALVTLAWRQTRGEISQLKAAAQDSAEQLAKVIVGNIETTMLQGDGIHVKNQVQRIQLALPDAEVRIYDPRGLEVFGQLPAPPPRSALAAPLVATLSDGQLRVEDGREWRPVANEERCHQCHPAGPALRGVVALTPASTPYAREQVLGELLEDGFVQIMTAEQGGELDSYFAELSARAPGIQAVGVYGVDGSRAFGVDVAGVTSEMISRHLHAAATRTQVPVAGGAIELIPLRMQERCEQCHEPDVPVRGVLAVSLAAVTQPSTRAAELSAMIDTSLRFIMLSSLGRMIGAFLDEVVATGAVSELSLYDADGRTYYTSVPHSAQVHVGAVLATRMAASSFVGASETERVRVVHPLINDAKCARCHGSDLPVRGAVSVSVSTRAAAEARDTAERRALVVIALALVVVLAVLYALLRTLVVSPVRKIGAVADAVGQGQLDVSVSGVHPHGDEMQRLGTRVNEMIRGLRTEFHMRRFVSQSTVDAARGAARATSGRVAAGGERCIATILFTDIRGFTAYSETVQPEAVVEMLNRFLQVQADIVVRYGGDIDKFVGDELMAVFRGVDGAARAVRAAIEMVAAVEQTRLVGETLTVGAGVSTGEVVQGPIGSADRMDFTVIGDVVNIGARLCSAAQGSEVIVSEAVRDACGQLDDVELEEMEALQLKGKRHAFAVYRAKPRRSRQS